MSKYFVVRCVIDEVPRVLDRARPDPGGDEPTVPEMGCFRGGGALVEAEAFDGRAGKLRELKASAQVRLIGWL